MGISHFPNRFARWVDKRVKVTLLAFGVLALPAVCMAEQTVSFNRDVRPLLSDRCFHCHGPNEEDRQAELRLDVAEGPDGAYRTLDDSQAIKPGSIEDGAIWYRLTTEDDDAMPPPDSSKQPLTDREKDIIRRWIEEGAEYADFWAFLPPKMPAMPEVENGQWSQQPIDRFVLRRLEAEGLSPSPTADRRTLIRRLTLDLTGLPPTREEIRAFLDDSSAALRTSGRPLAGQAAVWRTHGQVLAGPGSLCRHQRYAPRPLPRDVTAYRDWVIRAFNENLPLRRLRHVTNWRAISTPIQRRDQLVASGFNRLHLIIDRGTASAGRELYTNVVDRVTAVGTAFMGLTVQCAECHDHKYDPMTQKDFYPLFAFFNNLDGEPETGGRGNRLRAGCNRRTFPGHRSQQAGWQSWTPVDRAIGAARSATSATPQASRRRTNRIWKKRRQPSPSSDASRRKESEAEKQRDIRGRRFPRRW